MSDEYLYAEQSGDPHTKMLRKQSTLKSSTIKLSLVQKGSA
jgi:hypothetical protein